MEWGRERQGWTQMDGAQDLVGEMGFRMEWAQKLVGLLSGDGLKKKLKSKVQMSVRSPGVILAWCHGSCQSLAE